jgi:hypothetical protein
MKRILFLAIILYASVYSQEPDSAEYLQSLIEEHLDAGDGEEDSYFNEYIEELLENPININSAGTAEFSQLPFISSLDIQKIIDHRNRYGPFFSKQELYIIKDIPEDRVRDILPFVTVSEVIKKTVIEELFIPMKISIRSRAKKSNLDEKEKYSWGNFNRMKIDMNNKITAGLLTEKDEGEKQLNDLTTAYVKISDFYFIDNLIIGDYKIESGQGLLLWSGYGMPKNAEVINSVCKKSRGITPNSGSSEMSFFRGIAYEHSYKNFILRGFYSRRHRDAATDQQGIIRLLKDGYHRTGLELNRKNSVYEKMTGGSLAYSSELFEAALTGLAAGFSKNYSNSSNKLGGLSLSTKFILDDFLFYGEAARMENSHAVIAGFNINPVENIKFTTVFRKYKPDYINLYGFGFGERNGATNNEMGIYSGILIKTTAGVFSLYLDHYSFETTSNNVHNTLYGYDVLFHARFSFNKKTSLSIRYKLENKDDPVPSCDRYIIGKRIKQSIRGEVSYNLHSFSLRSRGEYAACSIEAPYEEGYMLMNEIKFKLFREAGIILRAAFYSTDSFNSAIYTYETGIPGVMENKVLSGNGFRIYTIIKIAPENFPVLYLKYSDTIKQSMNTSSVMIQMEMKY